MSCPVFSIDPNAAMFMFMFMYHQLDVDPDPAELIVRGEDLLSAAVQIIGNLLQPAPEMLLAPELQQYPQKSVSYRNLTMYIV